MEWSVCILLFLSIYTIILTNSNGIPNINEIQEIAFGSKNKEEAIGWIRQYAARHGYGTQVVDRFWSVFSKIEREDSYD